MRMGRTVDFRAPSNHLTPDPVRMEHTLSQILAEKELQTEKGQVYPWSFLFGLLLLPRIFHPLKHWALYTDHFVIADFFNYRRLGKSTVAHPQYRQNIGQQMQSIINFGLPCLRQQDRICWVIYSPSYLKYWALNTDHFSFFIRCHIKPISCKVFYYGLINRPIPHLRSPQFGVACGSCCRPAIKRLRQIHINICFSAGGVLFGGLLLRKPEDSAGRPDAAETDRRGRLLLQKQVIRYVGL